MCKRNLHFRTIPILQEASKLETWSLGSECSSISTLMLKMLRKLLQTISQHLFLFSQRKRKRCFPVDNTLIYNTVFLCAITP